MCVRVLQQFLEPTKHTHIVKGTAQQIFKCDVCVLYLKSMCWHIRCYQIRNQHAIYLDKQTSRLQAKPKAIQQMARTGNQIVQHENIIHFKETCRWAHTGECFLYQINDSHIWCTSLKERSWNERENWGQGHWAINQMQNTMALQPAMHTFIWFHNSHVIHIQQHLH